MEEQRIRLVLDFKQSGASIGALDSKSKVVLGKLQSIPETADLIKFCMSRLTMEIQRLP